MVGVLPAPTNGESLGSGSQCIRLWGKGQDPDLQQCDPSALTLGKADMDLSYCPGRSTWSLPHTMTTGLPQSVLPRDSLMGEAVTQHSPLWTAGPGSPQTDPPEVQPPDSSCSGLDNMESSRLWAWLQEHWQGLERGVTGAGGWAACVVLAAREDVSRREMRAIFSCMAWRAVPSPLSKLHRRLDSL